MITNAKLWAESGIEELSFPSGNTAKVKRVDLLDLLAEGHIPDTLTGQVQQLIEKKDGKSEIALDKFKDFAGLVNLVAVASFVEPKLVQDEADEDLDDNVLWVGRVSTKDKMFVFEHANAEAKQASSFRGQSKGSVGDSQPGDGVLQPAVAAAGVSD